MATGRGPNNRNSVFGKAMESMDISSLGVSSNSHLVANSIPLSSSFLSSSYEQNQDLKAITDKISKALNDFDQMYTDPNEEDMLINDITDQVDGLEGGMLKSQLKQFINNYKDMSGQIDEVQDERDEVLGSLADWFSTTQIDVVNSSGDDENTKGNAVNEALVTTKMKFEKLNRLNEEIALCNTRGRDTAHLQKEKKKMQKEVMAQVKEYKEQTNKDIEFQQQQINQSWKHAADEIMGLLSKVRSEGADYRQELLTQLENFSKMVKQMGNENTRLERELREKKFMERKWQDDNQVLTNAKSSLEYKMTRMKKELRNTRKQLSRHERVPKSTVVETDDEDDDNKPEDDLPEHPAPEVLNTQLQVTKKELESTKKSLETIQKEHNELQGKYKSADEKFAEKDRKIELLEGDKLELLHQMKKINMRPDERHLSKDSGGTPSRTSFGGSVSGISVRTTPSITSGSLCEHCGSSLPPENRAAGTHSRTQAYSPNSSAAHSNPGEKRGAGTGRPSPEARTATRGTAGRDKISRSPAAPSASSGSQGQLEKMTADLKRQLGRSNEENRALKDRVKKLEKLLEKVNKELERVTGKPHPIETTASEKNLLKPTGNDLIQLSYNRFPSTINMATEQEVKSAIEEVMTSQGTPCVVPPRASGEPKEFISRCIQTDPRCDPIGAWSKGVDKQSSWRPPMPPTKWIDYDPSTIPIETPSPNVTNLERAMLKGTEPSEVREVAVNAAEFVQRELDRMVTGISGFMEYLHRLIDREATMMAKANRQLRGVLSKNELQRIEQQLTRPFSSDLRGEKSNLVVKATDEPGLEECRASTHAAEVQTGADLNALQQFRDTLLPMEDKVKHTINQVCEEAISMLRRAHELIYSNLQTEHRQYEHIYTTIQDRTGLSFPLTGASNSEQEVRLGTKRSKSQSDVTALEADPAPNGVPEATSLQPRRSLSQTATMDNTGHLKTVYVDLGDKPLQDQDAKVRKKVDVAMATIPKKGLISLTTQPEGSKEMKTFQFSTDLLLPNKGFGASGRKTKPSPLNHQKLQQRQKELVRRTAPSAREEKRAQLERRFKEPFLEFVEDQFSGYTFQDLEAKMDQFTGKVKRESLSHSFESQFSRDTTNLLPSLQRRFEEAKTSPLDTTPTSLPPL